MLQLKSCAGGMSSLVLFVWAAFWCCTKRQNPKVRGAVWYDMFWDKPGHVDRHGRVWNESWRVILGP